MAFELDFSVLMQLELELDDDLFNDDLFTGLCYY